MGSRSAPDGGWTYGPWTNTGLTCTSTPNATPTNCPEGQVSGEFNGATICLPGGKPTDGAQKKTEKQTVTNPDGSKTEITTNTTTTCNAAGACSTNTTITTNNYAPGVDPGAGTPSSSSTESKQAEADKKTFCEQNPNSPLCKKFDNSFGGSCGGFSCDGDAIQCAIAREQHNRNCTLFDTATSLSDLGNKVASGVEDLNGAVRSTAAARDTVNLSSSLDTSKRLSGSLSDLTVTMWGGQSITLPFAKLNPYLSFMGSIVMTFAFVAGARIVGVV
jgi:hypothetical protein